MSGVTLSLLVLKTRHVEKTRRFYSLLGIELDEEKHGGGPVHHAGRVGDVVFEVYPLPADGAPFDISTRLGFVVDDLQHALDALNQIDVEMISPSKLTCWGRRAIVKDPDGRSVEIFERATL